MVVRRGIFGVALVAAVGGCAVDPAAPLIPTPPRVATMPPSQAPVRTADGFPNILADPVVVEGGLPRAQRTVDAEMVSLEAERRRAQAATRRIPRTSFANDLSRQARDSVADARAEIAASGRPRTAGTAPTPAPDAAQAIAEARAEIAASGERDPGATPTGPAGTGPIDARPIDPDAPLPRAVGPLP